MDSDGKSGGRVNCRFCLYSFMFPFAVLILDIKCLFTIFFVKPGYVVKWLFWMALTSIELTEKNNVACKKLTKSTLVSFF